MKNRKLLERLLCILLSAALIICGAAPVSAQSKAKKTALAAMSDIHYYPASLCGNMSEALYSYMNGSNINIDNLDAVLDAALSSVAHEAQQGELSYLVITGDLSANGEYEGHKRLAEKLMEFERESGVKVFVTNGNHDINNSDARQFSADKKEVARKTSPAEFYEIYKELGFSDAYHQYKSFTDGTQGALTYSVRLSGVRLIMLDAGKYTADATESGKDEHETGGAVTPEQLRWLLSEIADAKSCGEEPVLATHWNLSGMNFLHEKLLQGFVIDNAAELQEILADAGCHYALSGHQHTSDTDITYSDNGEALYSVIVPTVTQFPFAYRVNVFEKTENGTRLQLLQRECDEFAPVQKKGGGVYESPYRRTGFKMQFGGAADAGEYLFNMVKKLLSGVISEITDCGGIVSYIESKANIDIRSIIQSYIGGGISFGGTNILTAENIMSFLESLDRQLMDGYINNPDYLFSMIEKAIDNIIAVPLTAAPSTAFVEEYGFGGGDGGTLGDLLLSVMAYMYRGNEDISNDAFMLEMLETVKNPEFIATVFAAVKEYAVDDILIDGVLAGVDLQLDAFFVDHAKSVAEYIQLAYTLALTVIGSGIFTARSCEEFTAALYRILDSDFDVSLKKLLDTVLGTGYISLGKTSDELIYSLLDKYIGEEQKNAMAAQLYTILYGICYDSDRDYDVTYSYSGAVKVTPTKEDMQLPVSVSMALTDTPDSSFSVSWLTKYSVTGSDIEISEKGRGVFDGVPDTAGVSAVNSPEKFGSYGFDFGSFGILPWEVNAVKHTLEVSGLKAGTEYVFRVGDAAKGFWSEEYYYTTADVGGEFSFIQLSDTAGTVKTDYERMDSVIGTALSECPSAAFAAFSGNIVRDAKNGEQWLWALGCGNLKALPLMYAAGENDMASMGAMNRYFTYNYPAHQTEDSGVYYSYTYKNARFISLNTNWLSDSGALGAQQLKWLRAELENSTADWNILVMGAKPYGTELFPELCAQLDVITDDFKVDLILEGGCGAYAKTENGEYAAVSQGADFNCITVREGSLSLNSCAVSENGAVITDSVLVKNTSVPLSGDCDNDGEITAADARMALRIAVNLFTAGGRTLAAADFDKSGEVTAADARLILRKAVGLSD